MGSTRRKRDTGIPGIYTIGIYYLYTAGDTGGAWDLSDVHRLTGTTQILIAHPNGALLENISLNMTEKNNGVTSSLVSLDCNAKKGIASFDVEIPERVMMSLPVLRVLFPVM